jgi:hypothetical protein
VVLKLACRTENEPHHSIYVVLSSTDVRHVTSHTR